MTLILMMTSSSLLLSYQLIWVLSSSRKDIIIFLKHQIKETTTIHNKDNRESHGNKYAVVVSVDDGDLIVKKIV